MRSEVLLQDSRFTLTRFDHTPCVPHQDPEREEASGYAISIVERGTFAVHSGGGSWRLRHGSVFVTSPGMRYRCTHDSVTPDDVCLSLHCSPDLVEEAARAAGRGWDERVPVAPLHNSLAYRMLSLAAAIDGGIGAMAAGALAGDALDALLGPAPAGPPHRPRQLAWYAERIDAVRDLMRRRFAEPLTIEALGREVGISPFHFSRVFHDLVGVPPHRYLVTLRLDEAARLLRGGASVTQAALDSGFGNLGQFIRQFHRARGISPGRYRRAAK